MPQVNNCVESGGGGAVSTEDGTATPSRLHAFPRTGSGDAALPPLTAGPGLGAGRCGGAGCGRCAAPSPPPPPRPRRRCGAPRPRPPPRDDPQRHKQPGPCTPQTGADVVAGAIALTDHAPQWSIVHGGQGRTQPRMIPHSLF